MQDSLYRFRPLNTHTIDELKKSYLYFSTIDSLNDPMECFYQLCFSEKENENTDLYKNLFTHFLVVMRLVSIDFTLNNKELFKKDLAKKAFKIRKGIKIFDDIEAWVNENCKSIADLLINEQVWENEIKKHLITIYNRFYRHSNNRKELKFAESRVVEYLVQIRKFAINELLVCCFSKFEATNGRDYTLSKDEILMWAHYASGHSGICVEFSNIIKLNTNFGDKIEPKPIKYEPSENYDVKTLQFAVGLVLSHIEHKPEFLSRPIVIQGLQDIYTKKFKAIYNTKLDAWEKEYEYRISIAKKDLPNQKLAYKAECLKSITFGAKTSQCKQREMIRIVKNKNPNIRLYKVEIDENRGVLVRKPLQNSNESEV